MMEADRLSLFTEALSAPTILPSKDAMAESIELPLAEGVRAGFPSPAADYAGDRIDLVREMVRHPETTFYARVDGDSMQDAGIYSGDIVVIDRSLEPRNGDFVAACIDGEFTLKEYQYDAASGTVLLLPHNPLFSPIRITKEQQFVVWGVVTHSIHKTR